jgi:hypothetical protein
LLHTGHPTARNEKKAPAVPTLIDVSSAFAGSFFTYVANNKPERIEVITITGTDQLVTSISRPKNEVSKTAVGIEIKRAVKIAVVIATTHLRTPQFRRVIKYLFNIFSQ